MRYCEHCGQAINPGARFCTNCGAGFVATPQLTDEPETAVSAPIEPECEAPAVELPAVATPAYSVPAEERPVEHKYETPEDVQLAKEKACLDSFYRFLNLERLMWKIGGIALSICAPLLIIIGLTMLSSGGLYTLIEGILYLPCAIVSLCMIKRPLYYMNTLYSDARPTVKRCNSIGMMIFAFFFSEPALVFIIINFVRAKSNAALLESVIARQTSYRGSHL